MRCRLACATSSIANLRSSYPHCTPARVHGSIQSIRACTGCNHVLRGPAQAPLAREYTTNTRHVGRRVVARGYSRKREQNPLIYQELGTFASGSKTVARRQFASSNFAARGHESAFQERRHPSQTRSAKRHVRSDLLKALDGDLGDPDAWIRQLEPFLPETLRYSGGWNKRSARDPRRIVQILDEARLHLGGNRDLLSHMLLFYGRSQAVLYLAEVVLKSVTAPTSSLSTTPSNIEWPAAWLGGQVDQDPYAPHDAPDPSGLEDINVRGLSFESLQTRFEQNTRSNSYTASAAMSHIWRAVGQMVIAAARMATPEPQMVMSTALQILAQVHHNDLVPAVIYDYRPSPYSSTVNRPPMLHLLSGRIMTALSDAVWRSHQDENIARAAVAVGSIEKVYKDPPGGRFRLRVRDLGPEAWLEFVLWCCVETGAASVGTELVEIVGQETEQPWFAVNWCSHDQSIPFVDWQKVQMRTGGTVGRIEGYSAEEPLASIPPQTISTEVVLALVDGLVNSNTLQSWADTITPDKTFDQLKNLLSFLEPHSLPAEYFDYLTVRLLQMDACDSNHNPHALSICSKLTNELRDLETTKTRKSSFSLEYEDIVSQSLVGAGVVQQALTAFIHGGYLHQSIDTFSMIQYYVDRSKVQSLLAFVENPQDGTSEVVNKRTPSEEAEYIGVHGQLPQYITAKFMQLLVQNKELHLAQWLIYSDDIDGPVVPTSAYAQTSVAQVLVNLAAETKDLNLLQEVSRLGPQWRFKAAVTFIRCVVNAHIKFEDFYRARMGFEALLGATAGGYSPLNFANLAAAILRVEAKLAQEPNSDLAHTRRAGVSLFWNILAGMYDGTKGDFYRSQVHLLRQQIGHLLRILQNLPRSPITGARHAKALMDRANHIWTGNATNLRTATFNALLSGIVEAFGAAEGKRIWHIFCKDPRARTTDTDDQVLLDLSLADVTDDATEDLGGDYFLDDSADAATDGISLSEENQAPLATAHIDDIAFSENPPDASVDDNSVSPPWSDLNFEVDTYASNFMANNPTSNSMKLTSLHELSADPAEVSSLTAQPHVPDQQTIKSNPSVVPDINTIRIIARQAFMERETSPTTTKEILRWAKSYMRSIGRPAADLELDSSVAEAEEGDASTLPSSDDVDVQPVREESAIQIRRPLVGTRRETPALDPRNRKLVWGRLFAYG